MTAHWTVTQPVARNIPTPNVRPSPKPVNSIYSRSPIEQIFLNRFQCWTRLLFLVIHLFKRTMARWLKWRTVVERRASAIIILFDKSMTMHTLEPLSTTLARRPLNSPADLNLATRVRPAPRGSLTSSCTIQPACIHSQSCCTHFARLHCSAHCPPIETGGNICEGGGGETVQNACTPPSTATYSSPSHSNGTKQNMARP